MSRLQTNLKRAIEDDSPLTPTKRPRLDTGSDTTDSQGNNSDQIHPVILASFPLYQDIWDKLPTGTLIELARVVALKDIDLGTIPRENLEKLRGSNVASMGSLLDVLGCGPTRVMDKQVAEILDMEAQSIVAGDGKMLEYEMDKEISGRVHFTAALSMDSLIGESLPKSPMKSPSKSPMKSPSKSPNKHSGPSEDLPTLSLRVPQLGVSCLFARVFGSHRFLRVKILDRMRAKYRNDACLEILFNWARRPIHIFGRTFKAFVEKESTIWYYLEGTDRVGEFAEKRLSPGQYGVGRDIPDLYSLVRWWIPLEHNQDQLMCKLITRLYLGISGTRPGPLVTDVIVCKDIKRKVNGKEVIFTDGSGVISGGLARNQPAVMAFAKAIQRNAHLVYITLKDSQADGKSTLKTKFAEGQKRRWQLEDIISSMDQEDDNGNHADLILSHNVQLYLAVTSGLNIRGTPYFLGIWRRLLEKAVLSMTLSFNIEVPGSVYSTIVPDFTGELKEGQISFSPPFNVQSEGMEFTSGTVLVELANVPLLRERRGVIYFSTRGQRPLADILAGGDDVILIWEPSIVENFQNADDRLSEKPESVARSFERDAVTAGAVYQDLCDLQDQPEEQLQMLSRHLLGSLKVPQYLGIYNGYFIRAVHCFGIASEEARILGHKFNTLIDASRTSFRLTAEAVKKDRQIWDAFENPLWKRMKDQFDYHGEQTQNARALPNNRVNILDVLYEHGAAYHQTAWLEANGLNGGEAIYDQKQHEKLAFWWRQAEQKAAEFPDIRPQLELIRNAVKEAKHKFDKVFIIKSVPHKNAALIELAHWFASNPAAKEVPLVTGIVGDVMLVNVRASYAYILDTATHNGGIGVGNKKGFCWMMGIAPLLSSISSSPVTISFPTFAKLTPHSSFCEGQGEDN
ncbi:hypothetical protein M408DRAFT_11368 [Serendipita vermifera MAFF 305830]|uniref:RNA-dependent RNA polymerase n=1 Tax=Serendipita vermifera MAFF 305830 TaxID=933852 RepID=A0A0C2WBJ1_SERVB|nr:hypothetical protein M408DRAFT_11368 [Serendipita vermifera MAFF 305830]